jgi:serine/threonine protein kinase
MSLQFVVLAGPDRGRKLLLHALPDLMLGRSAQAYYQLTDPRVSRNHCQILNDGDNVTVICNGGSGGTLVNGKGVKRQSLKLGDVLQVGDTQMRLEVGDLPLEVALAHAPAAPRQQAAAKPDQLEALSGQQLGHYDIGPVIGRGSVSMVFHATDTRDNRPVAFKVLLPEVSRDDHEVQRFIRAMKTMLPLKHPNLVQLYAAGKTGGYCWLAMEFLAGENMMQVIERIGVAGMLDWRYSYKVAVHVARALAYAHAKQIIHRSVTPKNILLETPTKTVKLGNLMLAKALEGEMAKQVSRAGEVVGDLSYVSPEGTRGSEQCDARSDLYGLGATLYALLTGRPPFPGQTLAEQITRIRLGKLEKPSKYQMGIQGRFEAIVLKLLATDPNARYQIADELLRELEQLGKFHGLTV